MERNEKLSRRSFVSTVLGAAAVAGIAGKLQPIEAIASQISTHANMPKRPLGKTGHAVRIFSIGGQATLEQSGTDEESAAIIHHALDLGVNYVDTAAAYGRGQSEKCIGFRYEVTPQRSFSCDEDAQQNV